MAARAPRKLVIVALPVLSLPPPKVDPLAPYMPSKLVLHPRFLKPISQFERSAITSGYITRKWRYKLWDFFWVPFEDAVGRTVAEGRADPVTKWTWETMNKLTTRKGAVEEWVLRGIPATADEIEVQYPVVEANSSSTGPTAGTTTSETLPGRSDPRIPQSLITPLLLHLASPPLQAGLRTRLAFRVLMVPLSVLLAKVILPVAQVILAYNLFGIAASWRAIMGSRKLEQLLRADRIRSVGSPDFGRVISSELQARWQEEKQVDPTLTKPTFCWGDLDRMTVEKLETDFKIYELGRTYERARRVGMWKGSGVRAT